MPLLDVAVRPEWREVERAQQAQRVQGKVTLQIGLVIYGLTALGVAAWREAPQWLFLAQGLLFAAAFLWIPIRVSLPAGKTGRQTLLVAAAALVAMVALAALTAPPSDPSYRVGLGGLLPPPLSLLIPAGMLALLLWATRRHPGLSHALGLTARAPAYEAVIGLSLGIALGLHLWATVAAGPGNPRPPSAPPASFVWLLATGAALLSLGEELALRGALFPMLTAESRGLRADIFLRMIVFAAPLYLGITMRSPLGTPMPLGLLYGGIFAIVAIFLRFSLRSIVAPLCANIAFHFLMMLATYP